MGKKIIDKKRELKNKWSELKDLMNSEEQTFEQFNALMEIEDETYKQWKFYDGYVKAKEKLENEGKNKVWKK